MKSGNWIFSEDASTISIAKKRKHFGKMRPVTYEFDFNELYSPKSWILHMSRKEWTDREDIANLTIMFEKLKAAYPDHAIWQTKVEPWDEGNGEKSVFGPAPAEKLVI